MCILVKVVKNQKVEWLPLRFSTDFSTEGRGNVLQICFAT